jgi:hypothetical protein
MDIRVNDDTIPKTVNTKLKSQYIREKSYGRKLRDRRQTSLPGSPHENGNNKEDGS